MMDAIDLMPVIKSSPAYSVFRQMFDNSSLTLACDLFVIKTFVPKIVRLAAGHSMNLGPMGDAILVAVFELAEELRVSQCASGGNTTISSLLLIMDY